MLRMALNRRSAALHMARIMSWRVHEEWVDKLFEEYFGTPNPGYAPLTWDQLRNADREMFKLLANKTTEGIKIGKDGILPCDRWLPILAEGAKITQLLTTLPSTGASKRAAPSSSSGVEPPAKKSRSQKKKEAAAKRAASAAAAAAVPPPQVPYNV